MRNDTIESPEAREDGKGAMQFADTHSTFEKVRHSAVGVFTLSAFVAFAFCAALPAVWIDAGWYAELSKPSWAPPAWLFGPVWTVLYALMGIAGWGVWWKRGWSGEVRLWLFQWLLNAAWTPLFFGLRQPGWAFAEILLLWLAIIATVVVFARVALWTACALIPYLFWVAYAAVLTGFIWRMNN